MLRCDKSVGGQVNNSLNTKQAPRERPGVAFTGPPISEGSSQKPFHQTAVATRRVQCCLSPCLRRVRRVCSNKFLQFIRLSQLCILRGLSTVFSPQTPTSIKVCTINTKYINDFHSSAEVYALSVQKLHPE